MHPLLYHASGKHMGHCKPFNTNFSTLVYLQMDHYNSQLLNSQLILYTFLTFFLIYFLNLNINLTLHSYIDASKSVVYLFLCQHSPLS